LGWRLVVGLGNPGREYEGTRHNVGFMILDHLANGAGLRWEERFLGLAATWHRGHDRVLLLKPQTWMNLSGRSVQRAASFHKIPTADLVVLYDDLDLPPGQLRLRTQGGDGGHRGLRSVLELLGTPEVSRIRIGIGRPVVGDETSHVLGRFSRDEDVAVQEAVHAAAAAVTVWLDEGIVAAMNRFNPRRA